MHNVARRVAVAQRSAATIQRGRPGIALEPATIARLAEHPKIVAIKEATGSLDTASEIASLCGETLSIISGDDSLTLPLMSVGAKGVFSVVASLLPERVKALVHAAASGNYAAARTIHLELFPLFHGCLKLASNPIPIKAAMQIVGRDTGELRLPLCELDDARAKLETLLEQYAVPA